MQAVHSVGWFGKKDCRLSSEQLSATLELDEPLGESLMLMLLMLLFLFFFFFSVFVCEIFRVVGPQEGQQSNAVRSGESGLEKK